MRRGPRYTCLDCDRDVFEIGEYAYMLHDDLWLKAVPDRAGLLCVGCLERRLGRQLEPADFNAAPLNRYTFDKSDRLLDRQGLTAPTPLLAMPPGMDGVGMLGLFPTGDIMGEIEAMPLRRLERAIDKLVASGMLRRVDGPRERAACLAGQWLQVTRAGGTWCDTELYPTLGVTPDEAVAWVSEHDERRHA